MTSTSCLDHDRRRLRGLLDRLAALDLHLSLPHERGIAAVAHAALCDEIHAVARRLDEGSYWRSPRRQPMRQQA
jgi:hypothetical protein